MTGPTQPENGRTQRWRRWVLIGSLALNVLLIGAMMGAVLKGPPERRSARDTAMPYARALDRADQRQMRRDIRADLESAGYKRAERAEAYRQALDVLRADSFDPDAFRAVLSRQLDAAKTRTEVGQTVLIRRIEQMSAAERLAYADRIEEILQRGQDRAGRR